MYTGQIVVWGAASESDEGAAAYGVAGGVAVGKPLA